jgi:hypothetical protein
VKATLRTKEPIRPPPRTRHAYDLRDGPGVRRFHKDGIGLATKGLIRAHAVHGRTQFLFEDPGPKPHKKRSRKISGRRD